MSHNRLARLTARMRELAVAAAAIVPGAGMRYLTGQPFHASERVTLVLIPANDTPRCMVLPAMEVAKAHSFDTIAESEQMRFFPWHDHEGHHEALRQALVHVLSTADDPHPVIAIESLAMRVFELRAIEAAAPHISTVDFTEHLGSIRMAKDAAELAAMREAVRIIETALHTAIAQIKPGVTELQLEAIWKDAIYAAGGAGESFSMTVAGGPNSANPHHVNGTRPFQAGDLIVLDGGALYQGYASDITRTVALGEPSPEARCIYELVQASNAAGRAAVRPGVSGEAIDQAARQVIVAGGYGDYFLHRTGHGLGLEVHELPNIVAGSTAPLPVGTTFTIEPGIYINGLGGVRIEDDMVITETGGESLTSYPRDLIVLPVE